MNKKLLNLGIFSKNDNYDVSIINGVKCTPREIDIISCIINGRNTKSTANILGISTKTVENHTRNIRYCRIDGRIRVESTISG